jgi:hypothetical protein
VVLGRDTSSCMADICAKLFQNPLMYDKITVRTRMKWGRKDNAILNKKVYPVSEDVLYLCKF